MYRVISLALMLFAVDVSAQTVMTPIPMPTQSRPPAPTNKDGIIIIFDAEDVPKNWVQMSGRVTKMGNGVAASIDPALLEKSFTDFLQKVGGVFTLNNSSLTGGYRVEEIQLHVTITAEGSFGIIASAKAGMENGITVVLKRPGG